MKITVITTITKPESREDKWREALLNYADFADEVVVVNGGSKRDKETEYISNLSKVKQVMLPWPKNFDWLELPRHLNAGREVSTGDWIIKLDIDQLFHEHQFDLIRTKLADVPKDCYVATFQKMSMVYNKRYYQKGGQPIAFRNVEDVVIGRNSDKETDLCFPIKRVGEVLVRDYLLPYGTDLPAYKTGITYWNYDYFFKTKKFTKYEFWRFSKAYHRRYGSWRFGRTKDAAFMTFLDMMKGRHDRAPYTYKLEDHPAHIRLAVKKLNQEQFGCRAWGLI